MSSSSRQSGRRKVCALSWCLPALLLVLLLVFPAAPEALEYQAAMEQSRWSGEHSVFGCRLSQPIPHLGRASFYREAGEALVFELEARNSVLRTGPLQVISRPPAWKPGLGERELARAQVEGKDSPVRLDARAAEKMLAELARGMMPTLISPVWYDEAEEIRVALSPVHFQKAYGDYQDCLAGLLPVNFSQIERSTIFWKAGQTELTEADRRLLDHMALYTQADSRVSSFEINGFTDSAGTERENLQMSRLRATAVHEYLVAQGVDESIISTRYFGELEAYRIIAEEKSSADRDRNRRVTVLIRRD